MTTRAFLLLAICTTAVADDFPKPYNSEKTPGGPMPADEVARTMQLPPGFHAQVFAAEPDVQQPIAMAFDPKGRLWVAENYTYAETPMRWDTKLRDRIIILEDKDGDGKHDGRKVFWDQGTYLTSVEIGYGGVWVLSGGTLSFIPDKNGDDVPDGPPQVMLDGFNVTTIGHNIVNGLRWGPDGWLYGRHGITSTSAVGAPGTAAAQRTQINCGIWRFHPTRHVFEVVCQGGTNSWGHDWDEHGELFFINTVIGHLWHGIPGAYYRRMFGTHLNPHVYEVIEQTADHFHWDTGAETWSDIRKLGVTGKTGELGGGHAHVGMLIYQGGAWPAEYNGAMLTCNLHGNRINMDKLERQGCGYVGKHAPDFMKTADKWFRGIDLLTGPDGNVFVSDWSDAGECHDSDGVHRSSGRIYKISYGEPEKPDLLAVASASDATLVKVLASKNNYWERTASHALYERGAMVEPNASDLLASKDEHQRALAVDVMVAKGSTTLPMSDPSGLVRLHLASALQRLPQEARFPIATALAAHEEDASDRQQPLMIWYGIEPAVVAHPKEAIALIASAKIPTVRKLIARRLTEEIEKQPGLVDNLVALALKPEGSSAREDILRGMSEALQGWSKAPKPKQWDALASLKGTAPDLLRGLSLVFGSGRANDELLAIAQDANADAAARSNALTSLLRSPKPELLPLLKGWIKDKVLAPQAVRGLASYDDKDIAPLLLNSLKGLSDASQSDAITTIVSRGSSALVLLTRIEKGSLPASTLSPFQARQIRSLGDEALNQKLAKVWGEIRDTPEAKKQELEKYRQLLKPEVIAKADASKGRLVFASVCAACHKMYGEGAAIAPELTGSDRHNLNYLLENILDPNAVVPNDFRMTIVKLKDGRVLSGVIPEQNKRTVTVQSPAERVQVERKDIAETQQLPISLMPEGQLPAMQEEQVRDLFAYLMGNGQVPLPGGK